MRISSILKSCTLGFFAVLGAASCMFEPVHEQVVRSQRQAIAFEGVVLTPRAELILEASASPTGPFTQLTTTYSSGEPMMQGGATVYAFATSTPVPAALWAQTCAGFETFVRVRGGALVLTTYDSEAIAGVSAQDCIADAIAEGVPFVFAARTCASPYGAPVRLRTLGGGLEGGTLARDLRIVNPHQAQDYACVETIAGDLAIVDPTPSDIALPALTEVTGALTILYPRAGGVTRVVDLPALTTVGGDVALSSLLPEESEFVVSIGFGLPVLSSLGGDLSIELEGAGAGFDSVSGLPVLTELPANLSLQNLRNTDTTYGNLLPSLTEIAGDAYLDVGLTTHGVTPALEHVEGDFTLLIGTLASGLTSLVTVGGDATFTTGLIGGELPALQTIGGDLDVSVGNFGLTEGERYMESLALVGGVLRFYDSTGPVSALGMPGISVLGLDLDANPGLTELAASLSHISITTTGPITITDNPSITDCEAQSYVDSLEEHEGPVTISGNGGC